jgi:hypothetical protein
MQNTFIATGHGYEKSDRGRCMAFDGFTVLANPLGGFSEADRARRIFPGITSAGVTCASHTMALAIRSDSSESSRHDVYILVQHGGGREVWRLPQFHDGGALQSMILAMPEREQYALIYTLYRLASESRRQGQSETRDEWARAHVEKRIKTRRRDNRRYVEIQPAPATVAA